jgi:hypothetical protein
MDIPFQLSGWDTEARQLIAEDGCTVGHAVETVTLRYLRAGDYRPLFDSVMRGHTCGTQVKAFLAAMFDPKHRSGDSLSPRYEFGFKLVRDRGRPEQIQTFDRIFLTLWRGVQELAEGREPLRMFWRYLLAALDPDYRSIIERDINKPFPWRAKVQPIGGGRGRRCDPELPMRDKVLAWMVQQSIDHGEKYESAMADTIATIEKDRKEERWRGSITKRTVRNAYDRHAKTKPPK